MTYIISAVAFGLLVLFEIQKCKNVRKGRECFNPWFYMGTLLLLLSFTAKSVLTKPSSGLTFWAGLSVLVIGILFYMNVLGIGLGAKQQGYSKDKAGTEVSRKGLYGYMRHPGVWSFLVCASGWTMVFPDGLGLAVWTFVLNLIYVVMQDRCFFPVYLAGYDVYRAEVAFLLPIRRKK